MMKFKAKGRGVTLATLVLALGAAVYMNWNFTQNVPQTVSAEPEAAAVSANTGDSVAVLDPLETEAAEPTGNKNYGEAQLVSASQDSGDDFFESARLARTKARDEALDSIQKTLKNASLSEEEKEKLTEELELQVSNITSETSLENKIKAKGFADCVVTLGVSRADVTVMTENDALTADEVTQIRDVLLTSCRGLEASDITITEVK
ncbi:SpoIIIAH-like family protein [Gemmiger formicilis]|uniref:SpoIIIAH-like family protein n=1 Tax=Gemmiger formicilis TaxID=745368 RepID=UPI001959C804|nr:SpoIIIAH-like family protein [Gemmiger formicilis]MBM6717048.1 SpoIIIAH-like family protein [Gemmiger formicilis]